jgi:hypothetical protein
VITKNKLTEKERRLKEMEILYRKLYKYKESIKVKNDMHLIKEIIIMMDTIDILKEKINNFYINKIDMPNYEIENMILTITKKAYLIQTF